MKKILFAIISISFLHASYAQSKQSGKGNYFAPKGNYFERTLKPYNYQLTIDTAGQTLGKITFWRTEPIQDPVQKIAFTPNITFRIYNFSDKVKCSETSIKTKTNSTCKTPDIGGDMIIIGNFILLNDSPCVECANKAKVDYCRNIIKRLLEYITDTDSQDLDYVFSQLPIQRGTFYR